VGCAEREKSAIPDVFPPTTNISVYFSPPTDLNEKLSQLIDTAKVTVDGAFYSLRSPRVAQALLRASIRGVRVRLILDDDQRFREYSAYPRLKNFSLVKTDADNRSLMHNKFCIVDGQWVWTGSYNPNLGAIYENNDVVLVQSRELAARYRKKFAQFWEGKFHSPLLGNIDQGIELENLRIRVCFSPEDQAFEQILQELRKAQKSIYFATFTFTHPEIAQLLIEKYQQGVEVKGLSEFEQVGRWSVFPLFESLSMSVKVDRNYSFAFHHKFFLIDDAVVITGSFNPTKSAAQKNNENILIIESEEIAGEYRDYFQRMGRKWYGRKF